MNPDVFGAATNKSEPIDKGSEQKSAGDSQDGAVSLGQIGAEGEQGGDEQNGRYAHLHSLLKQVRKDGGLLPQFDPHQTAENGRASE